MSVEILAKLEADLRTATGNKDLRLCDYFDFVCGTSTGAIVAATWADGKGNLLMVRVWANGQVRLTNDKSITPHSLCTITFMRREDLGTDAWNRVMREALTSSKDSKDLVRRLNKQTKLNWTAA